MCIRDRFGEEDQSEIASLFHARIAKVETKADREKALKETILRVKQNSSREDVYKRQVVSHIQKADGFLF